MNANRIAAVAPDFVCLDEMSGAVNDLTAANAYAAAAGFGGAYTARVVSQNPGSHLNMVVFKSNAAKDLKTDEGIPNDAWGGDKTKRNLVRLSWSDPRTARPLYAWFLHANASSSGGKLAVELALDVMKGASCVFIGDFNNAGAKAVEVARTVKDAFAVMPITASAKGVPFTQWTHGVRSLQSDPALQIVGTGHDFVPNPNGCIDFALGSGLIQCVAVNALVGLSAADVGQIMMNIDHFPVAFDVAAA
jgi:endonuclease/exonuclease/phosphatase family metal-dependent hydrolase